MLPVAIVGVAAFAESQTLIVASKESGRLPFDAALLGIASSGRGGRRAAPALAELYRLSEGILQFLSLVLGGLVVHGGSLVCWPAPPPHVPRMAGPQGAWVLGCW